MEAPVSMMDCIIEPRYDTVLYPAAGSTQLVFFQVPIGQGATSFQTTGGGVGIPKNLSDTNMVLSGQLPGGYMFDLLGFRLMPSWDITDADLHLILNGAVFTFITGSKPFLTVPARTIPQGNGPSGSGASMNSNGWPILKNMFGVAKKPFRITQTQNFSVTLAWPSGQLTPATTATPVAGGHLAGLPLTVFLDGYLYRPVQ